MHRGSLEIRDPGEGRLRGSMHGEGEDGDSGGPPGTWSTDGEWGGRGAQWEGRQRGGSVAVPGRRNAAAPALPGPRPPGSFPPGAAAVGVGKLQVCAWATARRATRPPRPSLPAPGGARKWGGSPPPCPDPWGEGPPAAPGYRHPLNLACPHMGAQTRVFGKRIRLEWGGHTHTHLLPPPLTPAHTGTGRAFGTNSYPAPLWSRHTPHHHQFGGHPGAVKGGSVLYSPM